MYLEWMNEGMKHDTYAITEFMGKQTMTERQVALLGSIGLLWNKLLRDVV